MIHLWEIKFQITLIYNLWLSDSSHLIETLEVIQSLLRNRSMTSY